MLVLSHLGDPRNAFLLYFPVSYCLHRRTGANVLWLACISEWLNAVFKWLLFGERPYWWIGESGLYPHNTTFIKQYPLTCETGPGSPSGHAMVTSCVIYCMTISLLNNLQLRPVIKYVLWGLYILFMLAVTVSRCFVATHFPHQVILGTLAGIVLSRQFMKINVDNLHVKHYIVWSISIPASCLMLYTFLNIIGLDPGWSITLATKWCQRSEWVHLDTTPFNSIIRDAGSILGFGMVMMFTKKKNTPSKEEASSRFMTVLHIILTLLYSQVLENFKLVNVDPLIYYCFTFIKFCLQVVGVHFITLLGLSYARHSNKRH